MTSLESGSGKAPLSLVFLSQLLRPCRLLESMDVCRRGWQQRAVESGTQTIFGGDFE